MKKLIVRISEGLGNQLFMYAHAYALSKKINYELLIDRKSAYQKLKLRSFLLDKFNIDIKYAQSNDIQDNSLKYLRYKFLKKIDKFFKKKSFLIEKKFNYKFTKYENLSGIPLKDKIYLEGYFESEKYFKEYKDEISKQFKIKNIEEKSLFFDPRIIKDSNSVSIAIRQHRFSEKNTSYANKKKSEIFVKDTLNHIFKSMEFFKKKITNPKFFIFSNDITNLKIVFDNYKDCTIINHSSNKIVNDFFLSSLCKHFIVGPTTFHWWTAYLSEHNNKICICPPDSLKFSSNQDIFPSEWIKI